MDFLEKAKQTLSVAGKELGQKANELSIIAKLNLKIHDSEKRLQEAYALLGRQILEENEEVAKKVAPDMVLYIHQKLEEIADLKEELATMKTERSEDEMVEEAEVTVLSEPVDAEIEVLSDEEEDTEAVEVAVEEMQMKTCPGCGNKIQAADEACVYCGMKL